MPLSTEVMPSFYQDSVILMRVAAQVRTHAGVREVAMFMGTPANHALLEQVHLATNASRAAGANDLIITVDADDPAVAVQAIAAARAQLLETREKRETEGEHRPRTLDSALRAMPAANLVSLSIPGAYVKAEAMAALRRGLHLFVFSDNVALADEIEIKREALKRGLLCMGPDQGTAYLGGVGLGFANVVRRGRIGCVAASGTGLQAVVARLDALGEGVSHAIGVGGRDLSHEVGGLMTLAALDALALDASTEAVVVISKPPHPEVLARTEVRLATLGKPAVLCCIGAPMGGATAASVTRVATLDQAADAVLALLAGRDWQPGRLADPAQVASHLAAPRHPQVAGRQILGLYTGGTLAYEAGHLLAQALGDAHPHRLLDLGDDAYTVGRPHPMIDPTLRSEMIASAGRDPQVGLLLLDLVLGRGAHADPAASLVDAVQQARQHAAADGRTLECLAYVLGTTLDPQGLAAQQARLQEAGIAVFATHADAVRCAAMQVEPRLRARWLPGERA